MAEVRGLHMFFCDREAAWRCCRLRVDNAGRKSEFACPVAQTRILLRFFALKLTRTRIARAFGQVMPGKRGFDLQGSVDLRSPTCIYGWVWDVSNPSERICVVARTKEGEIAAAVADDYRSDLQAAGIGDGCHAFMLEFGRTNPEMVSVDVAGLGVSIPVAHSPVADSGAIQEGRDGWLFLRLGTNQVIRFFTEASYFTDYDAERWCSVLAARAKRIDELGARYFHLIVPDKLTVYRDNYIGSTNHYDNRPSRIIPLALARHGMSELYVDIASAMIAQRDVRLMFYRTDTHWTPFGALIACERLCQACGVGEFDSSDLVCTEYVATFDLGAKLDPPAQETGFYFDTPNSGTMVFANELGAYCDNHRMDHNHRGRQVIYRNDKLAGGKRLVIFGDSFCTTGSFLPLLSSAFYEVHFFWSTSVDFRYVEEVRPDVVVSEIAERFVKVLPDDGLDLREFARQRYAALVKSQPSLPSPPS
jgi:alginate O-acetyltransferase complex protein AlgJ